MTGPARDIRDPQLRPDDTRSRRSGCVLFTVFDLISVTTEQGSWVLPPQRVLWVPDGVDYAASSRIGGAVRHLVLREGGVVPLPATVRLVEASPLLRELLIEGERLAVHGESRRARCVHALILSEIQEEPASVVSTAMPRDARLAKLCAALLADPASNRTIDEWARFVGMSRRALTRNFRLETRMSFAAWRQQVRLQEATARLKMGQSVTRVAYEVGYESVSTFSTVFRQNFGTPPSRYARL